MVLSKFFDLSETVGMTYGGILLLLVGALHVLDPANSGIGMILNAGSELTNFMGIVTRIVGVSVFAAGLEVLDNAY